MSKFDELFKWYTYWEGHRNGLPEQADSAKQELIEYVHGLERKEALLPTEFKFDRERVLRTTRTQLEGRVLRNIEVSPPVGIDTEENSGTLLSDNQTDKDE